mmetsp:Transcript_109245/g.326724  ORF Transcript_109245/g.326724 Transcript_109245/m.326724 type:complete len:204 (-) Transcript_109245:64-675(-)
MVRGLPLPPEPLQGHPQLLHVVLRRPQVMQLAVVLLLGGRQIQLQLIGLLNKLQTHAILRLQVLFHAVCHDSLHLLVPAEVYDATEYRAEALRGGVPEVLEADVLDMIDRRELLRELEDRDQVDDVVVDVRALGVPGHLQLQLLRVHVVSKLSEMHERAPRSVGRWLLDDIRGGCRMYANHGQDAGDVLGAEHPELESPLHSC